MLAPTIESAAVTLSYCEAFNTPEVLDKPVLDWTNIDTLYLTPLELNLHCWFFCVYHLQIGFQKVNKSSSHYQRTEITSPKARLGLRLSINTTAAAPL